MITVEELIEHYNDDVGIPLWISRDEEYPDPTDELIRGFAESTIRYLKSILRGSLSE